MAMKQLLSIVLVLFLMLGASATQTPLIKYYSTAADSHACDANDVTCAYTYSVLVDTAIIASCASPTATKILGLSDVTNAHAEINTGTNYTHPICIDINHTNVFTSGDCNYVPNNGACAASQTCLFALSGITNAHLTTCGGDVFGTNQINLCCKSSAVGSGSIIPPIGATTANCALTTFTADKTYFDTNVSIHYACSSNALDMNIYIFDSHGNLIPPQHPVTCNIVQGTFTQYVIPSEPKGAVFLARGKVGDCYQDSYFAVSSKASTTTIPDGNVVSGILVAVSVLGILLGAGRRK